MGHYCKVCCRMVPAQKFTATGRKSHVCKACEKLPVPQQKSREAQDELDGFVRQSNLSSANVMRLRVLAKSRDPAVKARAKVLLEVALVHPHRSRRAAWLAERNPELCAAFMEAFGESAADRSDPFTEGGMVEEDDDFLDDIAPVDDVAPAHSGPTHGEPTSHAGDTVASDPLAKDAWDDES